MSKWSVVHLKADSWTLLRENNLEKKRWLFASDRLRVFAGTPNWDEEYAVANALEAVAGSLALAAFLEIVVCTHPQKLKVLDAAMVTSCFRKMALSSYPSPRPKQVPGQVGHLAALICARCGGMVARRWLARGSVGQPFAGLSIGWLRS